tara:strand:+ start:196 stop:618 length:423 start_codon:yes stop_codon:yes gene_type:complete
MSGEIIKSSSTPTTGKSAEAALNNSTSIEKKPINPSEEILERLASTNNGLEFSNLRTEKNGLGISGFVVLDQSDINARESFILNYTEIDEAMSSLSLIPIDRDPIPFNFYNCKQILPKTIQALKAAAGEMDKLHQAKTTD